MDSTPQQIIRGPFGDESALVDLRGEQKEIAAALYRIAARVNRYDIPGALILKAVAKRNSWLAKKGGR